MEYWITVEGYNCKEQESEDDFVKWFQELHMPDMMKLPEMKSAKFYQSTSWASFNGDHPNHFAVFRYPTDDIRKTVEAHKAYKSKLDAEGRGYDLFRMEMPNMKVPAVYKEINDLRSRFARTGKESYMMYGFSDSTDPQRRDEMAEWYKWTRQVDMLRPPGHVKTARMYEVGPEQEGTPHFMTIYEYDTDDFEATAKSDTEYIKALDMVGRGCALVQLGLMGLYREVKVDEFVKSQKSIMPQFWPYGQNQHDMG